MHDHCAMTVAEWDQVVAKDPEVVVRSPKLTLHFELMRAIQYREIKVDRLKLLPEKF